MFWCCARPDPLVFYRESRVSIAIDIAVLSVRLSVRPSAVTRSGIVSKRLKLSSCYLRHMTIQSF